MDRRNFLTLVAGASMTRVVAAGSIQSKTLVLVELQGGNDGLNTVVPYADGEYRKLRPKLSLEPDSLFKLDGTTGLHSSLAPLQAAWDNSQLAVVEGLGYESPNRSHFRSHDIWTSASDANELKELGWLANSLQGEGSAVQAVVFGNRAALFQGGGANYISMRRTQEFLSANLPPLLPLVDSANTSQRHLHTVLKSTLAYRKRLQGSADKLKIQSKDDGGSYGNNLFAKQLQDAALLIKADLAPQVITLHLAGFDTHANQIQRQSQKLSQLATGLAAFREELIASGHWSDTLVATWSEFGRRPAENDSVGTDHGTAAPQFVLGGRVRGGLYGQQPSLSELQNDDLVHTVDFRQLYSSITKHWWGMGDSSIDSRRFPALDILKT